MLKTETGNSYVSFSNIIRLSVQHGPIVGVIHRIHFDNTQSTFVFFYDEHVHESTGFACGEKNNIACEFLKSLIAMIPGCNRNVEGDIISMLGSQVDKLYKKAQENKTTMHYIFKPHDVIGEQAIRSIGYRVFEVYRQEIYTEDKGIMMEVERP
jgi:hypothetical protein